MDAYILKAGNSSVDIKSTRYWKGKIETKYGTYLIVLSFFLCKKIYKCYISSFESFFLLVDYLCVAKTFKRSR